MGEVEFVRDMAQRLPAGPEMLENFPEDLAISRRWAMTEQTSAPMGPPGSRSWPTRR
jgi:hypothetical protein